MGEAEKGEFDYTQLFGHPRSAFVLHCQVLNDVELGVNYHLEDRWERLGCTRSSRNVGMCRLGALNRGPKNCLHPGRLVMKLSVFELQLFDCTLFDQRRYHGLHLASRIWIQLIEAVLRNKASQDDLILFNNCSDRIHYEPAASCEPG